jgi:hypothetical protein
MDGGECEGAVVGRAGQPERLRDGRNGRGKPYRLPVDPAVGTDDVEAGRELQDGSARVGDGERRRRADPDDGLLGEEDADVRGRRRAELRARVVEAEDLGGGLPGGGALLGAPLRQADAVPEAVAGEDDRRGRRRLPRRRGGRNGYECDCEGGESRCAAAATTRAR